MIARESHGPVALLRLAHGKASAFDLELVEAIDATLADEEAGAARAVAITGTGSIFSAGVDLKRVLDGGRPYLERFLPALDAAFVRLATFPKPLVAAINGHAIAGGAILAFASDRRLLARGKGTFGIPELKVGVPFPLTALELARLVVPPQHHGEVVLSGALLTPEQCLARGLVDELVEPAELLPRALAVAGELAAMPPRSFAQTKRLLRRPLVDALEHGLATNARETLEAWCSDEVLGAVRAYVEKTLRR